MTSPPPLAQAVVGFPASDAWWQAQVYNPLSFLYKPPLFVGYQASAQSIPNSSFTSMNIDTEIVDSVGGHSTSSNPSRYTFQVAGWYRLDGMTVFATNTTGIRGTKFLKNGTTQVIGSETVITATTGFQSTTRASAYVQAAVGDYVELQGYQNSGNNLSTSAAGSFEYVTSMSIKWVST
ncbi:MAG TPA: hypothetical protein VN088_17155 [Nocardioides sp.]|nr:hypothetical protein [Nocardioides sp.]